MLHTSCTLPRGALLMGTFARVCKCFKKLNSQRDTESEQIENPQRNLAPFYALFLNLSQGHWSPFFLLYEKDARMAIGRSKKTMAD